MATVPMVNHTDARRRVARGPVVYDAEPGEVIDAYPMDVGRLSARGFARTDRQESAPPAGDTEESTDPLEGLTMDEIRELLPDDVEVPSKITRAELVELARPHLEA